MCTTGYVILLHEERHQKTTTGPCCLVKINNIMYNANVHVHMDMYLRGVSIYNVHVHVPKLYCSGTTVCVAT